VSELCELKIGQLRLHDPDGAHFNIPDEKTHTGIREVQMTPDLVEAVIKHIDLLRRCGRPTGPESSVLTGSHGASVDGLVRKARDRFAALPQQPTPNIATSLPRNGHNGEKSTKTVTKRPPARTREERQFAAQTSDGETGIRTRDTTIFRGYAMRLRGEGRPSKTGRFAGLSLV
jgi:hypothetical protein